MDEHLDRLIQIITAHGKPCLFCGSRKGVAGHHVLGKKDWFRRYTPWLLIPLCSTGPVNCHTGKVFSPHGSNKPKLFWLKLEETLKRTNVEQLRLINYWRQNKTVPERPDYEQLRADLEAQAREIENISWYDTENYDPVFRGRNERGQEIFG
jgi:hypothetical protein